MVADDAYNSFLMSVSKLVGGTAAGQLLIILASPLIARLYSPADFGLFAVFGALLGIISVVSSLRYELAIPLAKSDNDAIRIIVIVLALNFFIAAVVLIAIHYFQTSIAGILPIEHAAKFLYWLPLGLMTIGIYKCFNYWAVRKKAFTSIAQTKFSQSLANVCTQLIAGFYQWGGMGLILAQIVGQSAGVCSLIRIFRKGYKIQAKHFVTRGLLTQVKRHYRFPLFDTPAAMINAASEQLPQLLLVLLFSPSTAGWYVLAHRILMAPLTLIGQAVGQVLYAQCKERTKDGRLGVISLKCALVLWGFMVVPMIVLWNYAPEIFAFIFGEAWHESGEFAAWMILGIGVQFAYSPLSLILLATDGQKINFYLQSVILALRVFSFYLGWHLDNVLTAIIGYSISGVLVYGLGVIIIIRRAQIYSRSA